MRAIALVILFYFLQSVAADILYEIERNLNALKNERPSSVQTSDEVHTNEWGQKVEEITTTKQYNKTGHQAAPNTIKVITIDIDEFGNEAIIEKEIHVLEAKTETTSSPASPSELTKYVDSSDFGSGTNTVATSTTRAGYQPSLHAKDGSKSAPSAVTAAAAADKDASRGGYGPTPYRKDGSGSPASESKVTAINIKADKIGNKLFSEAKINVKDVNKVNNDRASSSPSASSSVSSSSSTATKVRASDFGSVTNAVATGGASGGGYRPTPHKKYDSKSVTSVALAAAAAGKDKSSGGYAPTSCRKDGPGSPTSARDITMINIDLDEFGKELVTEEKIYVKDTSKVEKDAAASSLALSSSGATRVGYNDLGSVTNAATTSTASGGGYLPNPHDKDGSRPAASTATTAAATASGVNDGGYGQSFYEKDGSKSAADAVTTAVAAANEVTVISIKVDKFGNELISEEKIHVKDANKAGKATLSSVSSLASSSLSAPTKVSSNNFGSTTNAIASGGASGSGYQPNLHGKDRSRSTTSTATTAAATASDANSGGYGQGSYEKDGSRSAANAVTVPVSAADEVTVISIKVDKFGNELISEEKIHVKDANKAGKATSSFVPLLASSSSSAPTKVSPNDFGSTTNAMATGGASGGGYQLNLHGKDRSRSTTSTATTAAATASGANSGGYGQGSYEKDGSRSAANAVTVPVAAADEVTVISIKVDKFGNELISEEKIHVKDASKTGKATSSSVPSLASSASSAPTKVSPNDFGSTTNAIATGGASGGGYQLNLHGKDRSRSTTSAAPTVTATANGASGGGYGPTFYGKNGSGSATSAGEVTNIKVDDFGNKLISEEKIHVTDENKVNKTNTTLSLASSSAPTRVVSNYFGSTTNESATGGASGGGYRPSHHGKDGSKLAKSAVTAAATAGKSASGGGYGTNPNRKDVSGSPASASEVPAINIKVDESGNKLFSEEKFNYKDVNTVNNARISSLSASSLATSSSSAANRLGSRDFGSASNAAATGGAFSGGHRPGPFRKHASIAAVSAAAASANGGRYGPKPYRQDGYGTALNSAAVTAGTATGDEARGRYGPSPYRQNGSGSSASELRPGSKEYAGLNYGQLNKFGRENLGAAASTPLGSASQYRAKEQPGAESLASAEQATTSTKKKRPNEIIILKDVNDSLTTASTPTSSATYVSGESGDHKGVGVSSSTSAVATAESSVQNAYGLQRSYGVRTSKNCRLFRKQLYVKIGTHRQPCFTC